MAKKQITISVDEQWLDAIDRNANPGFCLVHTLESLVVDFVAKILVPETERIAVSRAIADENRSRSASLIAANTVAEEPKHNIITVVENDLTPKRFMVWDEGIHTILAKVRDYPKKQDEFVSFNFCDMFPGKFLCSEDGHEGWPAVDTMVAKYLFRPEISNVACIYSIDLDKRQLGILKKWTDKENPRAFAYWRFFDLDKLLALQDSDPEGTFGGFPETIWYFLDDVDLRMSIRETPDIYIAGTKPLTGNDVRFENEVYQDGNLLSFYLGTYYDPDAVFGTNVCTAENDDFVNAYAYFDLDKDDVVDELSVVVSPAAPFPDEAYKYRLSPEEKALLRREMNEYLNTPDCRGSKTSLAQLQDELLQSRNRFRNWILS